MIRPPMPWPMQLPVSAVGGATPKQTTPFADLLGGGAMSQLATNPPNAMESVGGDATKTFGASLTLAIDPPEARIDNTETVPIPILELHIADDSEIVRIVGVPWRSAPSGDFSLALRSDAAPLPTDVFAPGAAAMNLPLPLAIDPSKTQIDTATMVPIPTLELQVADDSEVVRIVGAPWRLAPSGDFSQVLRGDATPTNVFAPGAVLMHPASYRASLAVQETTSGETIRIGVGRGRVNFPGIAFLQAALDATNSGDEMEDARPASLPPDTTASQPWLARVCRWILQHGGEPAVFLRDYRLDERTARALAEALHEHARTQGLTLRRIVCNGRELWRTSDHRSPTGET